MRWCRRGATAVQSRHPAVEYGCRVSRAWDVPRLARPYLEQLAAQVNVSAVLSIREGDRVMTLDQVEGHGSLRVVSEVGGRLPLHCTSQGKVFLAALAQSEAQALLGGGRSRHTRPTRSRTRRSCWHRSSRCGGRATPSRTASIRSACAQ